LSRTIGPILTKLGANNPWGREFKFSKQEDYSSPRGDTCNSKRMKIY
jgi:hypothetical protein